MGKQSGFSMTEMMVAVSIIGLLAAIAVPKYIKHQRIALQSEAKLAVADIYAREKIFYKEYGAYAPDMVAINYTPEGNKRFYNHGICNTPGVVSTVTGYVGTFATPYYMMVNTPYTYTTWNPTPVNTCNIPAVLAWCNTNDSQTFVGFANGILCTTCYNDTWTINEQKTLSHCSDGT
jgi:prepilin-type N-terminal cleavage/methylation domain-containing protein